MKNTLKILSWVEIVLGGLAVFGWAEDTSNGYALVGAILFIACGWVALIYIAENSGKQA